MGARTTATAGFTLIELMIVIAIIAVLAAIALPNLLDARKGANETAARAALRTLFSAQTLFREQDKDGDQQPDYATSLTELHAAGVIDATLASGTKQGYAFQILAGAGRYTWSATADPDAPGKSGNQYYFIDESGVIRYSTTGSAGPSDEPIGR